MPSFLSIVDIWINLPNQYFSIICTHSTNVTPRKQSHISPSQVKKYLSICSGCDNARLPPWQRGRHVQQLPCQRWALGGHGISRRWCLDRHRYSYQVSFFIIQKNNSRYLLFSSRGGLKDYLYELFIIVSNWKSGTMTTLFFYVPQVLIITYMYSSFIQLTFSLLSRN